MESNLVFIFLFRWYFFIGFCMNKQTKALNMVIEYLECPAQGGQKLTVINACKEALEQPAQEQILKSLRDEFAMAALQGMISTAGAPCLGGLDGFEKHAAKAAYKMADAMIKTRELKDE
jgi:hypothetical protein